ncbi:MAG TPA: hypothetical protein VLL52_00455 [Anaerolineae bacterium]|nr:hypothetical protein [Anaerolineae bacterium]
MEEQEFLTGADLSAEVGRMVASWYENAGLRDHLDDGQAKRLLSWGEGYVKGVTADAEGMAREEIEQLGRGVRQVMLGVNELVGGWRKWEEEDFEDMAMTLASRLERLEAGEGVKEQILAGKETWAKGEVADELIDLLPLLEGMEIETGDEETAETEVAERPKPKPKPNPRPHEAAKLEAVPEPVVAADVAEASQPVVEGEAVKLEAVPEPVVAEQIDEADVKTSEREGRAEEEKGDEASSEREEEEEKTLGERLMGWWSAMRDDNE